ncbi:MAG TPA: DNA alkylation repair protein [Chitinophagaceae bacterium]|nr:DNA alkylation repair protein [Chitinophagaceae bacterium]
MTAEAFIWKLKTYRSDAELKKYQRFFKFSVDNPLKDDEFIGVRMGQVFGLAKEYIDMPLQEIEKLMESPIHEVRAGAMSIMAKRAAHKNTTPLQLKELYELYIRRHDRINSWDLVDLAAYHVVGRYLSDKPRRILYKLARSKDPWERRTAIVATAHFILKLNEVDDTFSLAALLLQDDHELVHKGAGWMLRAAGDKDQKKLLAFLGKHAASMPRTMLRYSIEKLDKKKRDHYLNIKKSV